MMKRALSERGIDLLLNTQAIGQRGAEDGRGKVLICANGREIPYDEAIWCTQVSRD
jgi:hypothetical protein